MSHAAARRYAEALFELARDKDVVGPVSDGLMSVRERLAADVDLARTVLDPRRSRDEKRTAIDELGDGVHPYVVNVMRLLVDRRRADGLLIMILEFFELREKAVGVVRMHVDSARELTDEDRERLKARLCEATGKRVEITTSVDAELIGGLRIRVGSTLIDGTIKRRIESIGARLKRVV